MNKQFINILFIALFSSGVFGQSTVSDSLEMVLTKQKEVKLRLELMNQLSQENAQINFDKSIKYGNQALELALNLKNNEQVIKAYQNIGDAYSFNNNFADAADSYQKALNLSLKNNSLNEAAYSYNLLGINYFYEGKYTDAINCNNLALTFSRKNKIPKEEASALFYIGQSYRKKKDIKKAIEYYNLSLVVYEKLNDVEKIDKINYSLGFINNESGNYKEAIDYYEKALKYRLIKGNKDNIAILYNNIGNVLLKWGKYEDAINNYINALKTFEKIGAQDKMASCYNNIGAAYENLTRGINYQQNKVNYDKSLEYLNKALKIWETLGVQQEIANSFNNIGNVYAKLIYENICSKLGADWESTFRTSDLQYISKEYTPVIDYYRKSLSIREKNSDKQGIAISLSNLGKIYSKLRNYTQALAFLDRALVINKELNNQSEVSYTLWGIGRIFYMQKKYKEALVLLNEGLEIARSNNMGHIKDIYLTMSDVYFASGSYKESLETYKHFVEIQDSLVNENNMKQIKEIDTKYDTEGKKLQIQLLDIQVEQRNKTIYFFIAGMLGVLVITFLLIKQNKVRRKTNLELADKNSLITEQKKEITDSIHYASRIQKAIMPDLELISHLLSDYFIYFKPRDIVSGDFYWTAEKNGKIIVAAADCTGHGVPGAFMSMLGLNMLNTIISESENLKVDEILNKLRSSIIQSLRQTGREGENKDGMDLSLYILDPNELKLEFAGANNALFIVRNGELLETKADRMPIGIHVNSHKPFTAHTIQLQKNDMIYTFSDGYQDQFGGPENKKFMSAKFKKLLAGICNEPVQKQSEILHQTITDWMKDTYQIDDMLVIGVRV
jgi:tetratricopeptide (TPR) repeat protein